MALHALSLSWEIRCVALPTNGEAALFPITRRQDDELEELDDEALARLCLEGSEIATLGTRSGLARERRSDRLTACEHSLA
jgi:hypothetical protein